MEAHDKKMATLVTEINRMAEENRNLNVMLEGMISNYDNLQKQIKYEEKRHLTRVNGNQISGQKRHIEETFNFGILSPRSVNIDSSGTVSHQPSDSHERGQENNGKNNRFMDDQHLPSKKRKINHLQSDQFQNGMVNSSVDESPKKKHQALSSGSGEQTATTSKRIVSVRTRAETSMITDGCRWRKYGQKSTRNNPFPRSYYRCVTAPSCPAKKQVQRYPQDPTIVIITYEGEHTHSLCPLTMAAMHAGSSNQLAAEEMNRENFVAGNQFIPRIASISNSGPFPTITLDLTDNRSNPALQMQPPHLAAGSFQHSPPVPNDISQVLTQNHSGHLSIMESVSSITADPNFNAAVAVAIACSMLNLRATV